MAAHQPGLQARPSCCREHMLHTVPRVAATLAASGMVRAVASASEERMRSSSQPHALTMCTRRLS